MMSEPLLERMENLPHGLALTLGIALGVMLLLLLARRALLRWLQGVAGRAKGESLDVALASLRAPTLLWCAALGLAAGLDEAPVPRRLATWCTGLIGALIVLSVTMLAAGAAARYLQNFARRKQIGEGLTGIGATLSKVLVFTLGGLVALETLGIAITPLVTALGVGGIAVALALQDILSNLFAGIYLLVEKPVRVGDVIKLETGHEGTVADIGWRTTRIRMPPSSTIIVPNGKLIQSVLTVRDRQEARAAAVAVAGAGNHTGEA